MEEMREKSNEIIEAEMDELSEEPSKKAGKGRGTLIVLLFIIATIVITFIGGYLLIDSALNKSRINVYEKYKNALESLRKDIKQKSAEFSESQYHITNKGTIKLGNLQRCSNLEVLKVRISGIDTEEGNELTGITSWVKGTITCDFIVDLTAAEFIVDNVRKTVIVRVPTPIATNFSMDGDSLFQHSTFLAGSSSDGNELFDSQLKKIDQSLRTSVMENQEYYKSAKEAATKMITNAIISLNPDVDGIIVEVEYIG